MVEKNIKSRQRVTEHGEVFTPDWIVNDMLDLVKQETERIDSRFLEPACGTGNFLVEVLRRKLAIIKKRYSKSQIEYERYSVIAVSSIYGIDLLQDNVEETRIRLLNIFNSEYTKKYKNNCKEECRASVKFILKRNILRGDALTLLTDNNEPIVFSEWSAVKGSMIKRRDFTFRNLLAKGISKKPRQQTLFSNDYGLSEEIKGSNITSDTGENIFIPEEIKKFSLKHFLKLAEND